MRRGRLHRGECLPGIPDCFSRGTPGAEICRRWAGRGFYPAETCREQLSRYGQIACSAVRGVQKMFEKGRVDEIVAVNETQIAPGSAPHAQISGGGTVVNDEAFPLRKGLPAYAADALFKISFLVVNGNNTETWGCGGQDWVIGGTVEVRRGSMRQEPASGWSGIPCGYPCPIGEAPAAFPRIPPPFA